MEFQNLKKIGQKYYNMFANNIHFVRNKNGWNHKTSIKCLINPIFRLVQFYTFKPFVIASLCDITDSENPKFIKYQFKRVRYEQYTKTF